MRFEEETASTAPVEAKDQTEPGTSTSSPSIGKLLAAAVIGAVLSMGTPQAATDLRTRRRDDVIAESSTASLDVDPSLLQEVKELFEQGATEFFQDGMYSRFSRALVALLAQNGRHALRAIADYLFLGNAKPSVASEAVRWLAENKDPSTFFDRWAILQRTLRDRSPAVRDGAILGFASLDDPRALPLLTAARRAEEVGELRQLINQVLAQLERTQ
jgi:hypothetical protein